MAIARLVDGILLKKCGKCAVDKPPEQFHKNNSKSDGLQFYCKDCHNARERWDIEGLRRRNLRYRFGIELEEYDVMLLDQQGCCAICSSTQQGKRLAVDHNHCTSKVRGLLCQTCNTALGGFKDNIELLESAIDYLRKHND